MLNCNENLDFKAYFFSTLDTIDKNVQLQNIVFNDALLAISKYVHVSWEEKLNMYNTYPIGVYRKDRENWLKWYEEQKCKFIKFK